MKNKARSKQEQRYQSASTQGNDKHPATKQARTKTTSCICNVYVEDIAWIVVSFSRVTRLQSQHVRNHNMFAITTCLQSQLVCNHNTSAIVTRLGGGMGRRVGLKIQFALQCECRFEPGPRYINPDIRNVVRVFFVRFSGFFRFDRRAERTPTNSIKKSYLFRRIVFEEQRVKTTPPIIHGKKHHPPIRRLFPMVP